MIDFIIMNVPSKPALEYLPLNPKKVCTLTSTCKKPNLQKEMEYETNIPIT